MTQEGAAMPPLLTGALMLSNGAVQFTFTNGLGGSFTVISTTNLALPRSNWTVIGSATSLGSGVCQFISPPSTNDPQRFYGIRSP
ncbi:MAG TPA: hypothetical protein VGO59_12000 [Verrucomicrobiae bacterium]